MAGVLFLCEMLETFSLTRVPASRTNWRAVRYQGLHLKVSLEVPSEVRTRFDSGVS